MIKISVVTNVCLTLDPSSDTGSPSGICDSGTWEMPNDGSFQIQYNGPDNAIVQIWCQDGEIGATQSGFGLSRAVFSPSATPISFLIVVTT